jgi:molecular chaperone GrpE
MQSETGADDDATQAAQSPAPASGANPAAPSPDDDPAVAEEALAFDAAAEGPDLSAEEPGETDHERKLQLDLEELAAKAEKADEYLELAQRTKADFENFRKRAARAAAVAQERGVAKLARELLPAVDNLDRALAAAESTVPDEGGSDGAAPLVSGIKLVHSEVISALARAGIEPFIPEGEPFDPQCHEAVAQQPVEGAEPGTIVEVYQRGYRLGEAVLRPARVVVAG